MAGEPYITVIGNMAGDPELRFTASGHAVANFSVAQTPRTRNQQSGEWVDDETLWFRCSVWRDVAENVAETLTKGMRVIVYGRLKARSFETKEGEQRTNWELDVEEVGPSIRWATAQVSRTPRQGQAQQAPQPAQGGSWGQPAQQAPPQQSTQGSPWTGQPQSAFSSMTQPQQNDTPPPF